MKTQIKPVVVGTRVIKEETWTCPHCDNEIGEKELYTPEPGSGLYEHRPCGGKITLPERVDEGTNGSGWMYATAYQAQEVDEDPEFGDDDAEVPESENVSDILRKYGS